MTILSDEVADAQIMKTPSRELADPVNTCLDVFQVWLVLQHFGIATDCFHIFSA